MSLSRGPQCLAIDHIALFEHNPPSNITQQILKGLIRFTQVIRDYLFPLSARRRTTWLGIHPFPPVTSVTIGVSYLVINYSNLTNSDSHFYAYSFPNRRPSYHLSS